MSQAKYPTFQSRYGTVPAVVQEDQQAPVAGNPWASLPSPDDYSGAPMDGYLPDEIKETTVQPFIGSHADAAKFQRYLKEKFGDVEMLPDGQVSYRPVPTQEAAGAMLRGPAMPEEYNGLPLRRVDSPWSSFVRGNLLKPGHDVDPDFLKQLELQRKAIEQKELGSKVLISD